MAQAPAIQLEGVTKRYPGVVANKDVELTVASGEVHAIVGENGAGKSTLMKIIYGMVRPDEGTITINGATANFRTPKDAIDAGIGMVHQHFMLADNLTVLENVILGSEPTSGVMIDFEGASERIRILGETYGLRLQPNQKVEKLSVGERQRVEIIKVLYRGAQILILDEPTAVLVPQEVNELFDSIRDLREEGHTIIFISHKLDEVLSIADRITVMRDGQTVGTHHPVRGRRPPTGGDDDRLRAAFPGDQGVDRTGGGPPRRLGPRTSLRDRAPGAREHHLRRAEG